MPKGKIPQPRDNKSLFAMAAIVWSMVGGMIGCAILGYLIGKKFGDYLTGTFIGMFIGLGYCGYEIWKILLNSKNK